MSEEFWARAVLGLIPLGLAILLAVIARDEIERSLAIAAAVLFVSLIVNRYRGEKKRRRSGGH